MSKTCGRAACSSRCWLCCLIKKEVLLKGAGGCGVMVVLVLALVTPWRLDELRFKLGLRGRRPIWKPISEAHVPYHCTMGKE